MSSIGEVNNLNDPVCRTPLDAIRLEESALNRDRSQHPAVLHCELLKFGGECNCEPQIGPVEAACQSR
jgi:hypothetical protein